MHSSPPSPNPKRVVAGRRNWLLRKGFTPQGRERLRRAAARRTGPGSTPPARVLPRARHARLGTPSSCRRASCPVPSFALNSPMRPACSRTRGGAGRSRWYRPRSPAGRGDGLHTSPRVTRPAFLRHRLPLVGEFAPIIFQWLYSAGTDRALVLSRLRPGRQETHVTRRLRRTWRRTPHFYRGAGDSFTPSSSAASTRKRSNSASFGLFFSVHCAALSNHCRACSLLPSCQ